MSVRSRVRRGGLGEDEEGAGASGGRPHDQANRRLSVPHYRKAPPVSDPCASKLASAALDMRTGCGQQICTHSSSTFVSQPQNQLCRSSQVTCVGAILTPPHPLSLALNPTISMKLLLLGVGVGSGALERVGGQGQGATQSWSAGLGRAEAANSGLLLPLTHHNG